MSTNAVIMNGDGDGDEEFTVFMALHAGTLQSSGIPQIHWRSLHHKITNEVCLLTNLSSGHRAPYHTCPAVIQRKQLELKQQSLLLRRRGSAAELRRAGFNK